MYDPLPPPHMYSQYIPPLPNPKRNQAMRGHLRKGKWTPEEEVYAHYIIDAFRQGLLANLPPGTTLRHYLSEKLQCDPMRVTKKFAGTSCIGKAAYHPCERTAENMERSLLVAQKLADLEREFKARAESLAHSNHVMQSAFFQPANYLATTMYQHLHGGMTHGEESAATDAGAPAEGVKERAVEETEASSVKADADNQAQGLGDGSFFASDSLIRGQGEQRRGLKRPHAGMLD